MEAKSGHIYHSAVFAMTCVAIYRMARKFDEIASKLHNKNDGF